MATVATIFGGLTGFLSALTSLILFNASWLQALGVWGFGGLAVALMLLVLSLTSHKPQPDLVTRHA